MTQHTIFLTCDQADLRLAEIRRNKEADDWGIKYGLLLLGFVALATMLIPYLMVVWL